MFRYVGPTSMLEAQPSWDHPALAYCRATDSDAADDVQIVGQMVGEIWVDGTRDGRPQTDPRPLEGLEKSALGELKKTLVDAIQGKVSVDGPVEVLSDELTVLSEPYDGHRRGSAVIHRHTATAELYFVFDDVRLQDGAVLASAEVADAGPAGLTLAAVVGAFATGLVGGFAQKVGGAIFDHVFGNNQPPAYFDAVYDNLSRILREEIERNNREEVSGKMGGLTKWMDEHYWPWKLRDDPPVAELHAALEKHLTPFYDGSLQILERDVNRGPGALIYMAASVYYFAMLQEMALVNPNHQDDVHKAPENDGIRKAAVSHYSTLVDTLNRVMRERIGHFRIYKHNAGWGCWVAPFTCKLTAEDRLTEVSHYKHYYCDNGCWGPAERDVYAEMRRWVEARRPAAIQSLYDQLGRPLEVAHQWAMLSFAPLPVPRVPNVPMFQYLYAVTADGKLWVTPIKPNMQQSFAWQHIGNIPRTAGELGGLVVHRERLYAGFHFGALYEREPALADLPWRVVSQHHGGGAMVSMNDGTELWHSGSELQLLGPLPDLFSLGEPPKRALRGPQRIGLTSIARFHFGPDSYRLVGCMRSGEVVFSDVDRETPTAKFERLSETGGAGIIDMTQWQLDSGQTHVFVAVNKTEIRSFGHESGVPGIKVGDGPSGSPIVAIAALTVQHPKRG